PVRMRVPQRPHDRDGLLRGLAGPVHDLRVPGPPGPLHVHPSEPEILEPLHPPNIARPRRRGSPAAPQPYRSGLVAGRSAPVAPGPAACADPETSRTTTAT